MFETEILTREMIDALILLYLCVRLFVIVGVLVHFLQNSLGKTNCPFLSYSEMDERAMVFQV